MATHPKVRDFLVFERSILSLASDLIEVQASIDSIIYDVAKNE